MKNFLKCIKLSQLTQLHGLEVGNNEQIEGKYYD